jgi:hypothetical protein
VEVRAGLGLMAYGGIYMLLGEYSHIERHFASPEMNAAVARIKVI